MKDKKNARLEMKREKKGKVKKKLRKEIKKKKETFFIVFVFF